MTNEVAIKAIQDFIGWFKEDSLIRKALDMAIKALEQNESAEEWYKLFVEKLDEQEPCDDAISRADAQTEIMMSKSLVSFDRDIWIKTKDAVQIIRELPSVTQKSGKWIKGKCSICGEHAPFWSMSTTYYESNYCPNCGAKMVEPQESEEQK